MQASLQASMAAMQKMDETSAMTTMLKSEADSSKMINDTANSITDGAMDSANKAGNAFTKAAKAVQY
ncbi:ATP-dependent helicase HrpA [bacterium]|nr:ATP-dependent helicase HrpA [bacterium]